MAACNPNELMAVSACWSCLDERQIRTAVLALLCGILQAQNPMASCDVQSLMRDSACFACLPENQKTTLMLQLLCEILQSGGTGATSCNLCVEGADPTTAPPCDCSIYTRTDTGEMWYWRAFTAEWIKFISNT